MDHMVYDRVHDYFTAYQSHLKGFHLREQRLVLDLHLALALLHDAHLAESLHLYVLYEC